jgi:hypothetical protein
MAHLSGEEIAALRAQKLGGVLICLLFAVSVFIFALRVHVNVVVKFASAFLSAVKPPSKPLSQYRAIAKRPEVSKLSFDWHDKHSMNECVYVSLCDWNPNVYRFWRLRREERLIGDFVSDVSRSANDFELHDALRNSHRKSGLIQYVHLNPQPVLRDRSGHQFRSPVVESYPRHEWNLHQVRLFFHPVSLFFNRLERPNSSTHAAPTNTYQQSSEPGDNNGNNRVENCKVERPTIPVYLGIVFGLVFGGILGVIGAGMGFNDEWRVWRTALICCGVGSIWLACLFGIMSGLHRYTWGLPPQWLPAKWNPCPQDYRDYFPHGQSVTQKHLTRAAFMYYSKDMANVLAPEKQTAIIGSLCEGSSIRAIERMTGVHRDTVMRLGVRVGQGCMAMMSDTLRDLNCTRLEMDEIWGFIGKKEKHVKPIDDPRSGDVWTFCAIDADSKLGAIVQGW